MRFQPDCDRCGKPAAFLEVLSPAELPYDWESWEDANQQVLVEHRDETRWHRRYEGPGGSNGLIGDAISPEEAKRLVTILAAAHVDVAALRLRDNAGLCGECGVHYCGSCWSPSATGFGQCPSGHSASLDPHWSPD